MKKHLKITAFSIITIILLCVGIIFTCLFTRDSAQTFTILKSYFNFSSIKLGELTAMIFIILMSIIEVKLILNKDKKIFIKSILNLIIGLLPITIMFNLDVLVSIYGSFSLRRVVLIGKIIAGILALLYITIIIYYYKNKAFKIENMNASYKKVFTGLACITLIISVCVITKGAIKGVSVNKQISKTEAKANKLLASSDIANTIQKLSNMDSIKDKDETWEHVSSQHFVNGVPFYFNYQYQKNKNAFICSDGHYSEVVINIKDIKNPKHLVYYDVYLDNDLKVVKYYKTDNFDEIANRNELEEKHNPKEIDKLQSLCSDIIENFLDDVKENI